MDLQIKNIEENEMNKLLDSMERDFPKQVQRKMFVKAIHKGNVHAVLLKQGTIWCGLHNLYGNRRVQWYSHVLFNN